MEGKEEDEEEYMEGVMGEAGFDSKLRFKGRGLKSSRMSGWEYK